MKPHITIERVPFQPFRAMWTCMLKVSDFLESDLETLECGAGDTVVEAFENWRKKSLTNDLL